MLKTAYFATVIVLVLVVVASGVVAAPVQAPTPLAYRTDRPSTTPLPLAPGQQRQQPPTPVPGEDKAFGYAGDPYTTGRAYELPGYGAYNPATPPQPPVYGGPNRPDAYYPNYQPPQPAYAPGRPTSGNFLAEHWWQMPLFGCELWAADGTFLGEVTRQPNDPRSLSNAAGPYGSRHSRLSIFNGDAPYGAAQSSVSAWSAQAATPPALYWRGHFRCYVTMNQRVSPRISPLHLLDKIWPGAGAR